MPKRKQPASDEVPRSQRELERVILKLCAEGKDKLDRRTAPGVRVLRVPPPERGGGFPKKWLRREGSRVVERGTALWYIAPGADPGRRVLLLHGGSYVVWAPGDHCYRSLASRVAVACKACVLAPDYRMAPEHLFPAAYEDAVEALSWLASNGPQMESPATALFVCGDSAGGGLALAAALGAAPALRRQIRGIVSMSGWLDLTASTPSYQTRQWDPECCVGDAVNAGVDAAAGREEAEGYLGPGGVATHGRDWRCSPFFATAAQLRALPPVLFQVGDYELILDESVLLQQRAAKAGADATLSVYPRMWHCWQQYEEGSGTGQELRQASKALLEIARWVRARAKAPRSRPLQAAKKSRR